MNPSVLIVDDSLTVQMDLKSVFDGGDYACTLASTMQEAREALAATHFDLVVLDVLLPDGNGVDLLCEIRENPATASTPVIMLSVEADVHSRVRGLKTGAQEYVGKPYVAEYLLSRANHLVRRYAKEVTSAAAPQVLVIDDSATYRQRFKEIVEPRGYRVLQAGSGDEGLRLAAETLPLAIIVDGIMPGLDGLTVVRRLRSDEVLRQVPCLLVTAADDKSAELKALEAGADAFIRKDEDAALMLARLEALIRPRLQLQAHDGEASLFGAKRLLAISGDVAYVDSLQEHLLQDGYDLAVASDVNEAVELLQVQNVDCIFVEAEMSDRPALQRIKANPAWRAIPVILLAREPDVMLIHDAFDSGADDFVLKSSEFSVTIARIRNRLHRKQLEELNRKAREERLLHEARAAEAAAMKELAEFRERSFEQLKRTNRELVEARTAALEASEAKSEFLARMSHEIRTPLHGIIGMTELLQRTQLGAEQRGLLDGVIDTANLLLKIVNDVLDFSKLLAGKLEFDRIEFDLMHGLESTVGSFASQAEEKGLELVLVPGRDLPNLVRGDPARLRQVLTNLIGNAVKFTDTGEVVVRLSVEQRAGSEVTLRFEVKDTGIGIAKDAQAKLFQAFFQIRGPRQFGGTGLGLAIAAKLVEGMKGSIGLESQLGEGSTFHFSLPFEEIHGAARSLPAELAGSPVLVVARNCASREAVTAILESAGMRVSTAEASNALDEVRRAAAEKRPYSAAVIAHGKKGNDALALAAAIKADVSLGATRVVLVQSVSEDSSHLLARGDIDGCVSKPVTSSRLVEAILEALGLRPEAHGQEPISSAQTPAEARAGAGAHILVAEDNPMNRKLARMQLESLGYCADFASDGREAVKAQMAQHYPIILMDCEMPEMDGYEATREIRRLEAGARRTIVIAMTAHAVEGTREKCLAAGMDDYISKPVTMDVLRSALNRWTGAAHQSTGAKERAPTTCNENGIDLKAISELRNLPGEGGPSALAELIGIFLEDLPKKTDEIESALRQAGFDELGRVAHALRGAASSIGAAQLALLCGSVVDAVRGGRFDEARTRCRALLDEVPRTRAVLQQIRCDETTG